jgi:hypothetical protein
VKQREMLTMKTTIMTRYMESIRTFKGAMVTGDNQLFIPHYRRNPELFAAFNEAYVSTGKEILAAKGLGEMYDVEEFMDEYEVYAEDFLAWASGWRQG